MSQSVCQRILISAASAIRPAIRPALGVPRLFLSEAAPSQPMKRLRQKPNESSFLSPFETYVHLSWIDTSQSLCQRTCA